MDERRRIAIADLNAESIVPVYLERMENCKCRSNVRLLSEEGERNRTGSFLEGMLAFHHGEIRKIECCYSTVLYALQLVGFCRRLLACGVVIELLGILCLTLHFHICPAHHSSPDLRHVARKLQNRPVESLPLQYCVSTSLISRAACIDSSA